MKTHSLADGTFTMALEHILTIAFFVVVTAVVIAGLLLGKEKDKEEKKKDDHDHPIVG